MIQWGYVLFFGLIIALVVMMGVGVGMSVQGAIRAMDNSSKGKVLFWLGGPLFGLGVSGLFMGMIFQVNILTILLVALILSALMWGGAKLSTRLI